MIQCGNGLLWVLSGGKGDQYLHLRSGEIADGTNFDPSFSSRFFDGCDHGLCRGSERNFPNNKFIAFSWFDLGAQLDFAIATVVFGGIHQSALREVRQEFETFILKYGALRLQQFNEVMWQDASR